MTDVKLDALARAAWNVEDAVRGFPPRDYKNATCAQRAAYLLTETLRYPWRGVMLGLLIVLTYLELPLWCLHKHAARSSPWSFSAAQCTAPDGSQIYLSGLQYLPIGFSVLLEISIYSFLLVYEFFELRARGPKRFWGTFRRVRAIATLVALLDAIVFGCVRQSTYRLAPYCRVLLLAMLPTVRPAVMSVIEMLPSFLGVLAILATCYGLQAWLLAMMLDDVQGQVPGCVARAEADSSLDVTECDNSNEGFNTLSEALYNMMVAATNSDVPDQSIPIYATNRLYGVIFTVGYFIQNFVLLSFVLAVVYNEYQEGLKKRVVAIFSDRATSLRNAYRVLKQESIPGVSAKEKVNGLPYEVIRLLVEQLNTIKCIPYVPPGHVKYLFNTLDDNSNGVVSAKEFADLCEVLTFGYERLRTQSWMERHHPDTFRALGGPFLSQIIQKGWWGHSWTGLLIVNALAIFLESYQDLNQLDGQPGWPSSKVHG